MKPIIVKGAQEGMTLLAFLRRSLKTDQSVKALKRAIDRKQCMINGRTEHFSTHRVRKGDRIVIDLHFKPEALPVILFEDAHFIALSKPPGRVSESFLPYLLVHRLDKDTSGVFLLAKTAEAQEKMTDLFRKREVEKEYLAICDGVTRQDRWKVDNYLGPKVRYQGGVLYGAFPKEKGKHAITEFETLRRGPSATVVLARPFTGRTHQIRVHLKALGHPVLGDFQYAKDFQCVVSPRRHMLHALKLSFRHPFSKKRLFLKAPLLNDFLQVQKSLFAS